MSVRVAVANFLGQGSVGAGFTLHGARLAAAGGPVDGVFPEALSLSFSLSSPFAAVFRGLSARVVVAGHAA